VGGGEEGGGQGRRRWKVMCSTCSQGADITVARQWPVFFDADLAGINSRMVFTAWARACAVWGQLGVHLLNT
jgi:hypothetical protein